MFNPLQGEDLVHEAVVARGAGGRVPRQRFQRQETEGVESIVETHIHPVGLLCQTRGGHIAY